MLPRYVIVSLALWGLPFSIHAAAPVLEAPELGVAATLPVKWTLTNLPGAKYRTGVGPTIGQFRLNCQIDTITPEGGAPTLEQASRQYQEQLSKSVPGYRLVASSDVRSDSGVRMRKMVVENQLREPHLNFIYLGPAGAEQFFVLKGSVPIAAAEEYQKVFDGIAKTVTVTPPKPPEGEEKEAKNGDKQEAAKKK